MNPPQGPPRERHVRRRSPSRAQARSSGILLLEALIAVVLAAAVVVTVAQMLALVAQQRRGAQQRSVAAHEAGNLLEDFASRPWTELTAEHLATIPLSAECRQCLPDAALRVEVQAEPDDCKRIRVQIDWQAASGQRAEPVRLTAWRFRDEEGRP